MLFMCISIFEHCLGARTRAGHRNGGGPPTGPPPAGILAKVRVPGPTIYNKTKIKLGYAEMK